MFKNIYLTLVLATLTLAQTNFEVATKKYLQDVSDKKAVALYEKSCRDDKNAFGCYMAASLKTPGVYDPDNDEERRRQISDEISALYQSSCDLGYAQACAMAGELYDPSSNNDFSVTQDDAEKSAEFYEKACEIKNGEACLKIAKRHDDAAKFTDALKYYKLACEAGESEGCYNAADIYESGDGTPKDTAQAAKFYGLACENGLGRGCAKFEKFSK